MGNDYVESKEISILLDSAPLTALLVYSDMCWSFFVTRAYLMLVLLMKSDRKFEHKQQTFVVMLNFKLGSSLTLVLAQPHKQLCRLHGGSDASQQVMETSSSAWEAREGPETL